MKNRLFSQAYASLFQNTGNPTLRSTAKLRAMQNNCTGRNNPNIFYATVDARPHPKVVWSYNTGAHLGLRSLNNRSFFAAIHPFWLPLYISMAEFTYSLVKPSVNEHGRRALILTANVPLRNKSGKYYWYNQVSFAGTFDESGAMVEYFNEFHRLAEFDRMLPTSPVLTYKGNRQDAYETRMKEQVSMQLDISLRELLSPNCFKLLQAYRILKSTGSCTSRERVARHLKVGVQALDKGYGRLLAQARLAFPAVTLTTVANLAGFLNDTFGRPQRNRSRGEA